MRRNVEIKARVRDLEAVRARAAALATAAPEHLEQEDTFLACSKGRLKVRRLADGRGEVIFYRRPDAAGPKESRYVVAPAPDAKLLVEALAAAYGVRGVVRKAREVQHVGATRVHLDRVEGLGDFVELEVVLEPGQAVAEGTREAERLMEALGVPREGLVEGAYLDLQERQGREEESCS